MSTIKYIILQLVFILITILPLSAMDTVVTVRSETSKITEQDLDTIEDGVNNHKSIKSIDIFIYTLTSQIEVYRLDKTNGELIIETKPAYIKFLVTTQNSKDKQELKFFELRGASRKEILHNSILQINDYVKSL